MPQTCSVCKSKQQRSGIEAELIRGAALRDIAGHYGTARSAWHRHKTHVFEKLALVKRHEETLSAENLWRKWQI